MTREPGKNLAASIRARLLFLAQTKGEDYQRILGTFAIERFLYRLGRSSYRDPAVREVGDLLTMQLGPDQVLLAVDIKFCRDLNVEELETAIDRIETRIRREEPSVARIYLEADSLKQTRQLRSDAA